MRSILALGALAVAGFSAAQSTPQQNYTYTIDPNSVPKASREKWCLDQTKQCPLICTQQPGVNSTTTIENDCDVDTLTYTCICEDNSSPNITEYSQTLPYWICTEWQNQCVARCGQDNACSNSCRADHPCGAQNPRPASSIASATSTPAQTGAAATSAAVTDVWNSSPTKAPNGKGAASATMDLGRSYGLALVLAGVFAGFAIFL